MSSKSRLSLSVLNAPPSIISGSSRSCKSCPTSAADSGPGASPGPITTTDTLRFAINVFNTATASGASGGKARVIISSTLFSNLSVTFSGPAIVASPAPVLSAASPANSGAPTIPGEPPITSTWPYSYLWPSAWRSKSREKTSSNTQVPFAVSRIRYKG